MEEQAHTHLGVWLDNAVSIVLENASESFTEMTMEYKILEVGKRLFNLSVDNLFEVYEQINEFYEVEAGQLSEDQIIEILLIHAVSDQCGNRGDFVRGIMHMSTDSQEALMFYIQNSSFLPRDHSDDDTSNPSSPETKAKQSVESFCAKCQEKDNIIKHLESDLNTMKSDFEEKMSGMRSALTAETNRVVDAELAVIEAEKTIANRNNTLEEKQKSIEELRTIIRNHQDSENIVDQLQDEIDILRPKAAKLDAAEAQIDKLREKLEELADIKAQLRAESESHNATHEELFKSQQEIEKLSSIKPHLEKYKNQYADSQILVDELKLRLMNKDAEIERLLKENEALLGGKENNFSDSQTLAEALRVTSEKLREAERFSGVGVAMNELNPELMHEMNTIKAENAKLRETISKTSLESLENLEKDLADNKCRNSLLQQKLVNTKDELENAVKTIENLRMKLNQQQTDIAYLRGELVEASQFYTEEMISYETRTNEKLQNLRQTKDEEIFQMKNDFSNLLKKTSDEKGNVEAILCETQNNLMNVNDQLSTTSVILEETKSELEEIAEKRKRLEEQIVENQELYLQQLDEEKSNSRNELESRINELVAKHSSELTESNKRLAELSADLDQEIVKRRKVERVGKFYEAETQRLKTQLQVANTGNVSGSAGSSIDVQTALKELKQMQVQLDEANAEILILRSHSTRSTLSSSDQTIQYGRKANVSSNYAQQTELADKKIESLTREKREMIAKSLEENKEKMELSQKVLIHEKEIASLKSEVRKLTLEKDRAERKLMKSGISVADIQSNKENVII